MTHNIVPIKGAQLPPRSDQNRMDTIIITQEMVAAWKIPPFRINAKVQATVQTIRENQTIEGVLTLGKVRTENALYIVDGQHRLEAFKLSEIEEAIADVRVMNFLDFGEMAEEFVRLNSSLVAMRPDDILRGLENSTPALEKIRKACPYVGYDQVRRGNSVSPVVSMSALLRCWYGSRAETPANSTSNLSAAGMAKNLDHQSTDNLIAFLSVAHAAWGRDPEYFRLWSNLNLTLCMWLWNRLVMDRERGNTKRYAVLSIPEFKRCLMSVSANGEYISWLLGRRLSDRDRSPAYAKIKTAMVKRLNEESPGNKIKLPSPSWSSL
jgi:hypothetical protein